MNSQKILLTILTINLVISLAIASYNQLNVDELSTTYALNADTSLGQFYDDNTYYTNLEAATDYQYEKTQGNTIAMGKLIGDTFKESIKPFNINPATAKDGPTRAFAWALGIFKSLLWGMVAMEIYFIFKNRKTT